MKTFLNNSLAGAIIILFLIGVGVVVAGLIAIGTLLLPAHPIFFCIYAFILLSLFIGAYATVNGAEAPDFI